jgi:hypothetical protein
MASTAIHTMNALVLIRSQTPTNGVARLVWIAGAYVPAQAPQAKRKADA